MFAYTRRLLHKTISLCLLASLLLSSNGSLAIAQTVRSKRNIVHTPPPAAVREKPLYRAYIHFRHEGDKTRLAEWTTELLQLEDKRALVIVNEEQLANLARLQLKPRQVDSLAQLGFAANSLRRATSLQALATAPMSDSDGDGLTDTEEDWWCTDPFNPNSDGDIQGFTDGEEVKALLDFSLPRSVRWGYGAPFGPPNAWPDWNGQDGDPDTTPCNDGDRDTIPDFAEANMVGTHAPAETTDGDKFDDGQELFGITYCPGGDLSCGYGSYPRAEYWNFINETMPNWVEPPGDSPFVAAFPAPEINVVPNSWTVERVTTITTAEGEMVQATNSYETSTTRGQSTSIANTTTWNEWEEVSESTEVPTALRNITSNPCEEVNGNDYYKRKACFGSVKVLHGETERKIGGALLVGGLLACGVLTAGACIGIAAIGATLYTAGTALAYDGHGDIINSQAPNDTQTDKGVNMYSTGGQLITPVEQAGGGTNVITEQKFDEQGIVQALDGLNYSLNHQGQILTQGLQDISYQIARPRFTETRTNGRSWGGSQTTTHEEYEEHTITEGEAFTTGQNWSTAWAVDSSHAADLTFTYQIENTGTEYAREITGLIFNIYLGDDENPIISYPAWQQFPNGKLENLFPDDDEQFTSHPIPLTLEQMKRIDLGEPLTVVLEDFSYGADELFYQDAVNGGVTVFIEDGVHDDDETVDMYVIPTWGQESVQDVITRYFRDDDNNNTDSDGNLISLWTPEFDGINPPVWHEHFLSDIAWWNIYLSQTDIGNTPLHELPAEAGSAILFRFNRDSDRDGYQDRVEWRYGTDKENPASHPQPAVTAAYTTSRTGDDVTVLLKLANSGTFDAYGIDAVMYAPDDSVTITNNTVGGNGRVRPDAQVAVGSLILDPNLTNWGNSTAQPYVGGNYTGAVDKEFTFTVGTEGTVGQGTATLNWTADSGESGSLSLGAGYKAPLPITVADGLQLLFDTGTLVQNTSFTVTALTPRDTFQYTINHEPHIPPVIVVSYSDPQGSHRFVTPVEIESLAADLTPYANQMLPNVGLNIVTTDIVDPTGTNITQLIVNNPHPAPIENGHLYLNFVADGELVAEIPIDATIQSGPTIHEVDWSTATFSQTYQSEADNLLIAFWTDAQDNIIDSAARPLNSFQSDPQPEANIAATTWHIGTVTQGTVVHESIAVANTGLANLLAGTHINGAGLTASTASTGVSPAAFQTLDLTLDTATLPLGAYNGSVTVRTSDVAQETTTIQVTGTISAPTHGATAQAVEIHQPWNQLVTVQGTQPLNETITFDHPIVDDPSRMHPLYVYDETGQTLFGVGEFGVDFENVSTTADIFGTGRDGDVTVANGQTIFTDNVRAPLAANAAAGQTSIQVGAASFQVGDEILIIQMQRNNTNENYELARIIGINGATLEIDEPLIHAYSVGGNHKAQVIRVPHYRNVTVQNGGILTARAWNGTTGGVLFFRANGEVTVHAGARISMTGKGYRRGARGHFSDPIRALGWQGEGFIKSGVQSIVPNSGGGGGGQGDDKTRNMGAGGGGGGYGSTGATGQAAGNPVAQPGFGGGVYGFGDLTKGIFPGGGGGGGGADDNNNGPGGHGGDGGGIIVISARNFLVTGLIEAHGANGLSGSTGHRTGGGGGGAGGSILLQGFDVGLGTNRVVAQGGSGGAGANSGGTGGNGGLGRIHVQYCNSLVGSTNPSANTGQIDCFIARQLDGSPNSELTLPTETDGYGRFQLQYGQRGSFSAPSSQDYTITLPKRTYTAATLEALFVNLGTSNFTVSLDVGADGSVEWNDGGQEQPALLASPNLAAGLNAYLQGTTAVWGTEIAIPIRVTLNSTGEVFLTNFAASTESDTDLLIDVDALTASDSNPTETDSVALTATVQNDGPLAAKNVIVSFFAGDPNDQGVYLGGRFVANLDVEGSATVSLLWDTTGYSDQVELFAMVDAVGQIGEGNEDNNTASTTATVKSRPDLQVAAIELADLPRQHRLVEVKVSVHNDGDTNAGEHGVTLYQGDLDNDGNPIGQAILTVAAKATTTVSIPWSPQAVGEQQLYAVVDDTHEISEFDESNNSSSQPVYVGWGNRVYINAGSISDLAYDEAHGYGYTGEGITESCGEKTYQTYRKGESTEAINYRFDHLLPGRFYHLDLSFYLCSGTKTLRVLVDGVEVESAINISSNNNDAVYRSILLDPSLYADNSIEIAIEKSAGLGGPVISELMLSDIHYCYRDSGHPNEIAFANASDGCGWLDGEADQSWGNQPFQSVRFDDDGQVRYQFDNLSEAKEYRLNFTFYDETNSGQIQSVSVDGHLTLGNIVLNNTQQFKQADVITSTYQSDGSIVVTIEGTGQTLISEIALEEKTIIEPNRAPIAVHDNDYLVEIGTELNVDAPGVLVNDSDEDGDVLTAILQNDVSHGNLTLNSNGSFSYLPDAGFSGQDSFTYRADDSKTLSEEAATVTITVIPNNQLPNAAEDTYNVSMGNLLTVESPGILTNDDDPDGDVLTAVLVNNPNRGQLILNPEGGFTYQPDTDFVGEDVFIYYADDGEGSHSEETAVTINVLGSPLAQDDRYNTLSNELLVIAAADGVLANDVDPNGGTLTAVLLTNVANGQLNLQADGSFTYISDSDFAGTDTFTYHASDGELNSDSVIVEIVVQSNYHLFLPTIHR